MTGKWKRWTAVLLTGAIVMSYMPAGAGIKVAAAASGSSSNVPAAAYSWEFESGQLDGKTVKNAINSGDSSGNATLHAGAQIVQDGERGSVLSLPGGNAGTGGWLSLPSGMYGQVSDQLTFMMWVNLAEESGPYTRLFASTIKEKGLTESGVSNWNDPEFSIVTGGGTYNQRMYTGTNPSAVASYKGDLAWEKNIAKGKWQHVAVSMNKSGSYEVYIDGAPLAASSITVSNSSSGATKESVLNAVFKPEFLAALTHNDFGRSLYKSDADVKGKFDDIRFYNTSLTAGEIKTAYDQYFAPEPDRDLTYLYTFDEVNGTSVLNGTTGGAPAVLGAKATIVQDAERGAVLNLPGGASNAGSWLTLPAGLFDGVNGDDGFAISLWLNVPAGGASYSRLFSASPYELGASEQGHNWWMDPEFAIVRGGGDYDVRLFNGVAANKAASNGADIIFDQPFKTDKWQHLVLTMNKSAFDVYLDGQPIANVGNSIVKRFAAKNIAEALPSFFDSGYVASLVNSALGRSLYGSDQNFIGKIDDFAFYKRHLTAAEAAALSGIGDATALNSLIGSAEQIAETSYTPVSFAHLQQAIQQAKAFVAEQQSHTQGAIDEQLRKLQGAIDGLKEKLPETLKPDYYYSFDLAPNGSGQIRNESTESTYDAKLQKGASILTDAERGKVLDLPGGNNGTGGWLDLPTDLFKDVTKDSGFTVAMWVKLHSASHSWSRLFDAGSKNYGSGETPFFYVSTQNGSEVNTGNGKQYMNGYSTPKSTWAHVAYTVKDGKQTAYVNGIPVKTMEANNDIFTLAQSFDKNAIGRSRFSADPDLRGQLDDVMFFKNALDGDGVMTLFGNANDSRLSYVAFAGQTVAVQDGSTSISFPLNGIDAPSAPEQIVLGKTNSNATAKVEKVDGSSYKVTITSSNGKIKTVYTISFFDALKGATANFLMTQSTGPIMHGASGFLYGISEPNVPTIDLLSPLKPKVIVQKAPGGLQHPSGDGVRISDSVIEAGVEQIQIYIQDSYYQWPYEYKGLDQYEQLAVNTVKEAKSHKNSDKFVYVIFNEPDGIWFGGKMNEAGFFAAWKRIYDAVKKEDPNARIAGPNVAGYNTSVMDGFMSYCKTNNCIPDVITWHELGNDNGSFEPRWEIDYNHYRSLEKKYGIAEKQIVINEYSWFEDPGAAGSLIQWLARFETKKVYGSIAYWHLANSLNELAADANKPNGAWWLYKWYADMTGDTVQIETEHVKPDGMYGLASIDADKKTAYALFGGQDGVLTSSMQQLADHDAFKDATSVHVKLYRTKFTGYYGMLEAPAIEFDGDVALKNGSLDITVGDANALDGFYAIVTPATGAAGVTSRVWTKTYEAEAAVLSGVTIASLDGSPVSGLKYVDQIGVGDSVAFAVEAPQDGVYKLEIYYGNNAKTTNGRNRAQGDLARQNLTIDGGSAQELVYASTIFNDYFASKTVYVDLTAGSHTIKLTGSGGMDASLDKLDLTYVGKTGTDPAAQPKRYEVEEADLASGLSRASTGTGYSSGGYAEGKGAAKFNVVVAENGYYDLLVSYAALEAGKLVISKRIVDYAENATTNKSLTTKWSPLGEYTLKPAESFKTVSGIRVYLTAGANTIQLDSANTAKLDYLELRYDKEATNANTTYIEAESAALFGTAAVVSNSNFSGGKYVDGIGESSANGLTLSVEVKEAGRYKLSVDYSNNEPAPAIVTQEHPDGYIHPYNTDLVERYAQIIVNDDKPQTVYFINTLAWNSQRNVVVDIELNKGSNTITLYNDNSYRFSNVKQYAPYFDRFAIAKSVMGQQTEEPGTENPGTDPGTGPGTENPGSGTPGNSGATDNRLVTLFVDGKETQLQGKISLKETAGRKTAQVLLDDEQVLKLLEQAGFNTLTIPVEIGAAEAAVTISAQLVMALKQRGGSIELKTEHGTYVLPASEIKLEELAKAFGEQVDSGKISIRIVMAEASASQLAAFHAAYDSSLKIIAPPLDFKLEAVYEQKTIAINIFSGYVTRGLALSQDAAAGATTGVVLTEDGQLAHVPTRIVLENGRYYAYISSMTNSLYAVVAYHAAFTDLDKHWSKAAVEEMASRLIVSGVSADSFMPERSVTRAEFAAILVRGLGLRGTGGAAAPAFSDVPAQAWYAETIKSAVSYGLMMGYEDGTFRPNRLITREEMFVMLDRALKLAGAELVTDAVDESLAAFKDAGQISGWARNAAAAAASAGLIQGFNGKLAPQEHLSRAEAAVMIKRLLEKAKLT